MESLLSALLAVGLIDAETADIIRRQENEEVARQWAEGALAVAAQGALSAQQQRLLSLLAESDYQPTERALGQFWQREDDLLWTAMRPQIEQVLTERATLAAVVGGQAGTFSLINQQVIRWAETYYTDPADTTYGSIPNLNLTSRQQVADAFTAWNRGELPGRPRGLPSLIEALTPTFGSVRAERIAITESTRIFTESIRQAGLTNKFTVAFRVLTSADDRVCFPAGTLVETEFGALPIESLTPGVKVMTRSGLRSIVATNKRLYSGVMRTVKTEIGQVTATANHPFWTLEQGWLNCGQLDSSCTLETFDNKTVKILGTFDFCLQNSTDLPSVGFQVSGLSSISLGILMPISTIDFERYVQVCQEKINAVASHLGFLNINYPKSVERVPDSFFKHVFAAKPSITRKATELAIVARNGTKIFSAISAGFDQWRAAAFFRTKSRCPSFLFAQESFSAPFAGMLFPLISTFPTTDSVAVGYRCEYGKLPSANRASFDYIIPPGCQVALLAAESPSLVELHSLQKLSAMLTMNFGIAPMSVASRRTILLFLAKIGFKLDAALRAGLSYLFAVHDFSLYLHQLSKLYHKESLDAIYVYDLQVDEVPEFYANGILVHNCPICGPVHGTVVAKTDERGFIHPERGGIGFPPFHVRCRCGITEETEATLKIPLPPEDQFVYGETIATAAVEQPQTTSAERIVVSGDIVALQRTGFTQEKLVRLFDIGNTATAKVTIEDLKDDGIVVFGQWLDTTTRESIGTCTRVLLPDSKEAHLHELAFEPQYIGNGVGMKVARAWFAALNEAGYEKAELYAGLSIGRYAWAKEGAEYADPAQAQQSTVLFREWLKQKGIALADNQLPVFGSVLDVATWRHPQGVTLTGGDISNQDVPPDMVLPLGKAFMLDSTRFGHGGWDGVIDLTRKGNNGR